MSDGRVTEPAARSLVSERPFCRRPSCLRGRDRTEHVGPRTPAGPRRASQPTRRNTCTGQQAFDVARKFAGADSPLDEPRLDDPHRSSRSGCTPRPKHRSVHAPRPIARSRTGPSLPKLTMKVSKTTLAIEFDDGETKIVRPTPPWPSVLSKPTRHDRCRQPSTLGGDRWPKRDLGPNMTLFVAADVTRVGLARAPALRWSPSLIYPNDPPGPGHCSRLPKRRAGPLGGRSRPRCSDAGPRCRLLR